MKIESTQPTFTHISCFLFIVAVVAVSSCSRPDLNIPQEAVGAGHFCVSTSDCQSDYVCTANQLCCKSTVTTDCKRRCISLMQKPLDVGALRDRLALSAPAFSMEDCVVLCCQGMSDPEIHQRGVAPQVSEE